MSIRRKLLEFYRKNHEILEEMLNFSENREIAYRYESGNFGKRPSILQSENDVIVLVKNGVLSFHCSVERWEDPLELENKSKRRELDELRIGWDLLLDIDGKNIDYSKEMLKLIIDTLKSYGLKESDIGIKFSGGSGFHLIIPWEVLPKEIMGEEVKMKFPEIPRIVSTFIAYKIEKKLKERLNKYVENVENPFELVNIDSIAISSRHLFRMPFSINEKTNYLSIPVNIKDIKFFSPEEASLDFYEYNGEKYVDLDRIREGSAEKLVYSAIIWSEVEKIEKGRIENLMKATLEKEIEKEISKDLEETKKVIKRIRKFDREYFPPCIKLILKGLEDGRKRSVFILINFLKGVGYSWDEIKDLLEEWNEKNPDPLREKYIEYQIEWHKRKYKEGTKYLPPNCANKDYYKDIGVCNPDEVCILIKNPLQYPIKKYLSERAENVKEKKIKDNKSSKNNV